MTNNNQALVDKINSGNGRTIRKISEIVPVDSLNEEEIFEIWVSQAKGACRQLHDLFGFRFSVEIAEIAYSAPHHMRLHRNLSRKEYMQATGEYVIRVGRELDDGFFLVSMKIIASPSTGSRVVHIFNSEFTANTKDFKNDRQEYLDDPGSNSQYWESPNAKYKPLKQSGYVQPLPDLRFLFMQSDELREAQFKMARQLLTFFKVKPETDVEKEYFENALVYRFAPSRHREVHVMLPTGALVFNETPFEFYQNLNDKLPRLIEGIEIKEASKRWKWANSKRASFIKKTKHFVWEVVTFPFWLVAALLAGAWEFITRFPELVGVIKKEAEFERELRNVRKYGPK